MKFHKFYSQILGKIKFWEKPIFDLYSIKADIINFTLNLQEKCNLILTEPKINPPKPNSVLGHTKETIRYNYAEILLKQTEWLDHIELGFGENGYYYDCYIKVKEDLEFDILKFREQLLIIINYLDSFEKTIESKLSNYFFNENNIMDKPNEISNCNFVFEIKNIKTRLFSKDLLPYIEKINLSSEKIVRHSKNILIPEIIFRIFDESLFYGLIPSELTKNKLFNKRFFTIKPLPSSKGINDWLFSARGVPVNIVIETISSLLK